jgi:hypothetical protein
MDITAVPGVAAAAVRMAGNLTDRKTGKLHFLALCGHNLLVFPGERTQRSKRGSWGRGT